MKDPHGQAILDYYKGKQEIKLVLGNSYGEPEEMPVEAFFTEPDEFSEIERTAMTHCRGKVLDIGAAAGAHALFLQAFEAPIYALDNSPGCAETMRLSGVKKVIQEDYQIHKGNYDTILLMMNGLGIAGKLEGVPKLLSRCRDLLNPGGHIVFDSSDISYLYEEGVEKPDGYFGEVRYRYEYNGQNGDWFDWVYVDQTMLQSIVAKEGLEMEVILTDDQTDQYLGIISGF